MRAEAHVPKSLPLKGKAFFPYLTLLLPPPAKYLHKNSFPAKKFSKNFFLFSTFFVRSFWCFSCQVTHVSGISFMSFTQDVVFPPPKSPRVPQKMAENVAFLAKNHNIFFTFTIETKPPQGLTAGKKMDIMDEDYRGRLYFFCISALGNPGKDFGAWLEVESRFAPP